MLQDVSVTIPRNYKNVSVNSFFPFPARPWNSLPAEFFLLACDLNCCNSRFNRHLFSLGSFKSAFLHAFYLCLVVFLENPCRVVLFQSSLE